MIITIIIVYFIDKYEYACYSYKDCERNLNKRGYLMKNIMFKDLPISEEILNATIDMGFETATEVQEKTIPLLMNGQDVVAQSQTGTGKTASFGIPLIDIIDDSFGIQGLVVCPTRELALQVVGELKSLSKISINSDKYFFSLEFRV